MRLGASSISASAKALGAKSFASKAMAVALGATLAVGSLGALAGCSNGAGSASSASSQSVKQVKLDPSNPVALTVWHYYNGAQQIAFDNLLSEFNSTVGKEKGIYVEAYSQGSVSDLEKAVSASAQNAVGSSDLPDIFSTYADTAYSVQQSGKLVDRSTFRKTRFPNTLMTISKKAVLKETTPCIFSQWRNRPRLLWSMPPTGSHLPRPQA